MSKEEFQDQIYLALEEEKKQQDKLIKELIKELPDKKFDDPNTCLFWPLSSGWSQAIEDILEESGYDIVYLSKKREFFIEFSDKTKKEIKKRHRLML